MAVSALWEAVKNAILILQVMRETSIYLGLSELAILASGQSHQ